MKKIIYFIVLCAILLGLFIFYDLTFGLGDVLVHGSSMEPTFYSDQVLSVSFYKKPVVNDVLELTCFSKCTDNSRYNTENIGKPIILLKRLIKIDSQGCYWVEGDNKPGSVDSRIYGWICPSDFRLDGVVVQ